MAFYNSHGQELVLVNVRVPSLPATLSPSEQQELADKCVEFGQLWHLVKCQSPTEDDLLQVNLFWQRYGVPSTRGQRNWTSIQAPKDHLARLKKCIRQLGGDPGQVGIGPLAAVSPPGQPVAPVMNHGAPSMPGPATLLPLDPATYQPRPAAAPQQAQAPNSVNDGLYSPDGLWDFPIDPNLI